MSHVTNMAEQIFLEAQSMAVEERSGYLSRVCKDRRLFIEVQSLLDAAAQSEHYFTNIIGRMIRAPDQQHPTQVGCYRILKLLGRGGMGAVYLGERVDGEFEKQVAVKVLPKFSANALTRERFLVERQILAELVHPHICRLMDGGMTEDGLPFFVMDYVDGQRIDAYCDNHSLGISDRLELFLQVCDAVKYAHQKLILHRDIKPGNILIDANGQVQLLDFGVGEFLVDKKAKDEIAARIPVTLFYASPETIQYQTATTSSDVYSLGVTLYQLLTGLLPHDNCDKQLPEALLTICEQPAMLASDRLSRIDHRIKVDDQNAQQFFGKKYAQQMKGDLDAMLNKCLAIDPEQRYQSVENLIDDIRRYQDHRMIHAMKPTLGYRMGKFLRRYPISIILSIMSMGLLVSLAVISTQSAISSASQIKLLEAERDKAEKIKDFVASIVRSANPMGMGPVDPPVGDLLVNAALRLDSMYGIDVEIRIELMTLIAESLLRLRGVNSTSNMIASIVDEAEYVLGENHPLTLHAKAVQFSSEQLPGGLLDWEDKVKLLPIQMSNVAEVDPEYLLLALSSRVFLATQEWQHDTAEKVAKHAYQMAVSKFGVAHPQTVEMQLMLSTSYRLNQQHKLAVDTAQHAHSLVFNKLKLGLDHPLAVKAKMTYGMALAEHDQIEAGLRELTSAVENSSVVFGPESQVTIFTQYDLARYQRRAGQLVESIKNHEKVLEFAKTDLGEQIPSYITVLSNTTRLLIEARHTDSSMIRAREFLRLVDVADNPLPYHVNRNAAQLAVTLSLMNQWQLTDARRELGKVDPGMQIKRPGTMLDPVYVEGILLRLEGRYTDALKMQYNTLARMNDTNERHRNEMHVQAEIGFNYLGMNEVDKAEDKLKTALTLFQQKQLQITPRQADVMVSLARVYLMTDRADQALSLLEAADQFWHEFNQTSWWAGQAAMWLSKGLDAVGDQQRSDVTRQRAKKILSKFYNTTNGNNVADANTKGLR